MPTEDKVFDTFPTGKSSEIRISETDFHGQRIDIRKYFCQEDSVMKPTTKGIMLDLTQACWLRDALSEALKQIASRKPQP